MNSRRKGACGELEFCKEVLQPAGFLTARRGRQYSGSPESPDVKCDELSWIQWEVKRRERLNVAKALEQAARDAGEGQLPIVGFRANREDWKVALWASDFMELLRELIDLREVVKGSD